MGRIVCLRRSRRLSWMIVMILSLLTIIGAAFVIAGRLLPRISDWSKNNNMLNSEHGGVVAWTDQQGEIPFRNVLTVDEWVRRVSELHPRVLDIVLLRDSQLRRAVVWGADPPTSISRFLSCRTRLQEAAIDAERTRAESEILFDEGEDSPTNPSQPWDRTRMIEWKFREVYLNPNRWKSDSDAAGLNDLSHTSGSGSRLDVTADIRCLISELTRSPVHLERGLLVDVACGDMHWMGEFLSEHPNVKYVCLEVVKGIVEYHRENLTKRFPRINPKNVEFHHFDVTAKDAFQSIRKRSRLWAEADADFLAPVVLLVRHLLMHFPVLLQKQALWNIARSGADLLLMTSGFWETVQKLLPDDGSLETLGDYAGSTDFLRAPFFLPRPLFALPEKHGLGVWLLPFIRLRFPAVDSPNHHWICGRWTEEGIVPVGRSEACFPKNPHSPRNWFIAGGVPTGDADSWDSAIGMKGFLQELEWLCDDLKLGYNFSRRESEVFAEHCKSH